MTGMILREGYRDCYARWAESREPTQTFDVIDLSYMDILPGDKRHLDIASRYYIHQDWYAVSQESYSSDFEHLENALLRIEENIFDVKVDLSGENVEETHWFRVHNDGGDGKPSIVEIER